MADVRLIDANALPNFKCKVTATIGDQKGPAEMRFVFWQDIEKAPTIDAVPVVRCRECKHWSGRNDKPGEVTAIGYCNHPNHHIMPLRADWFCADGEKMDGGAEG